MARKSPSQNLISKTTPACGSRAPPVPLLAGTFPPYPLKEELEGDRNFRVVEAADYIATTAGTRTYPWRLVGIADRDADLITNQLRLAPRQTLATARYLLDQARQSRLGLVELQQPLQRRFQSRGQHPNLQVLHRLRRKIRPAIHHHRRGLVQARQRTGCRSGNQYGGDYPPTPGRKT